MTNATDTARGAPGLLPWRHLLAAALTAAVAACGPTDPSPSLFQEVREDTTLQQQGVVSWGLGARYDSTRSDITFRVYSSRATRIMLYLYKTPYGAQDVARYVLVKDAATSIWSKTVSVATLRDTYGITGPVYYGYRAWGPNWPYSASWTKGSGVGFISDVDVDGNRFNPNKLVIDPYALEISHDPINASNTHGTVFASGPLYRNLDSGRYAPKGIVLAGDTQSIGTRPTRALKDDVIYEVHVRGLTKNDPSIPPAYRGTYKGAGLKAPALAALGVTAVEFLPVQETENDANDNVASTAGDNYWGYMTLNYFAPDRRYAADRSAGGPTREFKEMVKAFHDSGIKAFTDVVYNHTGEGGAWNGDDSSTYNLLSWRGLDNPTYYSLTEDRQFNWDNTGVGGNFNTYHPVAQDLIIHSLAYWRDTLGVDGFRFDLASVLGNTCQHGCFNYDKMDSGADNNGNVMEQHRWFKADGTVPDVPFWDSPDEHAISFRIDGSELGDTASALYVAYNGWYGDTDFFLPWPGPGKNWYRVTDTCNWAEGPEQVATPGTEALIGGEGAHYGLCGHGLLLLIAQ